LCATIEEEEKGVRRSIKEEEMVLTGSGLRG